MFRKYRTSNNTCFPVRLGRIDSVYGDKMVKLLEEGKKYERLAVAEKAWDTLNDKQKAMLVKLSTAPVGETMLHTITLNDYTENDTDSSEWNEDETICMELQKNDWCSVFFSDEMSFAFINDKDVHAFIVEKGREMDD